MVVHASSSAGTGPFALLLRRYRLDAGLTQGALADQAGVSARTIQHLEAGMSQPQADTTHRLSAALGLQAEARANFLAAGRPAFPYSNQSSKSPALMMSRCWSIQAPSVRHGRKPCAWTAPFLSRASVF